MISNENDPRPQKLSVIIPCYNGAKTIRVQLEALARQQWIGPWEIIVADNGSTDDTLRIVRQYEGRLPNLRIVDASARPGAPYARNVGIRVATGDAIVFCDADDEVGEGWLMAMGEALKCHDFIAGRQEASKLNEPWVVVSRGRPQHNKLYRIPFAPHLCTAGSGTLGVRRSLLLDTIKGFDESLPRTEDALFCVQLQLAGAELHFVPDAVVHIRYRTAFWDIFRQGFGEGENLPLLYKKLLALGLPGIPRPWRTAIVNWVSLLRFFAHVRNKPLFACFLYRFGWRLGNVKGSIKHRVVWM